MSNKILIYSLMIIVLAFSVNGFIGYLNINSPPNNFYTNNQTPAFSFDIYGNTSTNNCTLYIDGIKYGTNDSIVNGTIVMVANDTLSEAPHTWYVNCTDTDGINITETRNITVDTTRPGIQMISSNIIDGVLRFEDVGRSYVVEVYFDSVMNESVFPNLTFSPNIDSLLSLNNSIWYNSSRVDYTYNINYVNLTVMDINLTVTNARDLAGNPNNDNNTWTVILDVDTQEPILSIDTISNAQRYTVSQIDLNYTVSGQQYCWYELDGELTNLTFCENTTLSNLTEGIHSFLLYANDTVNNVAYRSIIFYIDTVNTSYTYSISHSQISRANNSQEFAVLINWNEQMNQSVGPTLYFTPSISTILNSCGYYWLNSNTSLYNCTIYYILPYEQFNVNLTIFNASDLAGNMINITTYVNVTNIDMTAPQQTTYSITPYLFNEGYIIGDIFNFSSGFNYTGTAINSSSCGYSLNGLSGSWYYNQTAFNGTHCVFNNVNSSGFNNSIHTLYVFISDLWKNNVTWGLTSVFRDVSAPTTTPSGNGYTFDTWTSNPVNVTFACSDGANSSGCQAMYTCWDSTNTCTPTNLTTISDSIFISSQGTFYVRYYSKDNLNNTESVKNVTVKIGITNSSATINMSSNQLLGSNALPYLITGTASGGASGIDTLTLYSYVTGYNISSISGNNWNYSWNPSAGTYNLTAQVCDLTTSCVNSTTISNITIDLTAPTTTNNADTANWSIVFVITLSPTDTNGVSYTSYRIGSLTWQNGTTIIINGSNNISSGNILIRYYSVDAAGNSESEKNVTVKYDITAPTSTITGFLDDYSPYTFNQWSDYMPLVNLSGNDTYSGYNRTLYCTDTSNTCTPSTIWNATLNITTPGITYIRYRSVDNLNNTEVTKISRVMILQNTTIYINESLNVTENETNIIVPADNNDSNIYIPPNVNATLDFSERINISSNESRNVTLNGSINTTVNTTIIIIFEIPENITLSGNSSWLGNFSLPKLIPVTTVTVTADSGYAANKDLAVEIGADDLALLLNKAVRIRLTGKYDKLLGYYRNGFVKITDTCVNDTQEWADENLANDTTGHCRTTDGADLIIWTKHLSTFVTYTQTEEDTGGGGGRGGGGGGSSSSYVPSTNATLNSTANPSVTYSYSLLESGTRIINVTHSQIPLYGVALTTTANLSNVKLKITLIENPPVAQAETVYKYFQIDHETINDSIISGAKLQFKVAKSWLTENTIEKNQVVLYRYINGWNILTTKILKEDADSIYYESSSPGLSVFAIATKPRPPVTVVEPTEEPGSEPSSMGNDLQENNPEDEQNSNPLIVSIIVISLIVVLLYIFYAKKYQTGGNVNKK